MRILLICADREVSETIADRVLADSSNEIDTVTGLAQAARRDLAQYDGALVWYAQLQGLDGGLLKDLSQVSRRIPLVAVLSRALWSTRRLDLSYVDGWFFIDDEKVQPADVLRLAAAGYWVLPGFVVSERGRTSREPDPFRRLSPAQQAVLQQLCCGRSNRDIALQLNLPEQRVKKTVHEIIAALGLSNRTQAAVLAHAAKLRGALGADRPDG